MEKKAEMFLLSLPCPPREDTSETFETVNKLELVSVERLSGESQKHVHWLSLQRPAEGKIQLSPQASPE